MSIKVNKHKKSIHYVKENMIWLSNRNIITVRLFKKFENKMLKFFKVLRRIKVFYKLKLLKIMKIHDVFHSNLFRLNLEDSFENQNSETSRFIETLIDDEWVVNDILDFRHSMTKTKDFSIE